MLDLFELHKEDICFYNYSGIKDFDVISAEEKNRLYFMRPDRVITEVPVPVPLLGTMQYAKGAFFNDNDIYYCTIERPCFYV